MLLWHEPCASQKKKCCCGISPVHFGKADVAVALAMCISEKQMLMWQEPCAFRKSTCCCGINHVHFGKATVAVAQALCISENLMDHMSHMEDYGSIWHHGNPYGAKLETPGIVRNPDGTIWSHM
jgi:hypothetical protein